MDSVGTAMLWRLSFASELSSLSICFQRAWKGLLKFHKDKRVCTPTDCHTARRAQDIVIKPSLIQSCLISVLNSYSHLSLSCHICSLLCICAQQAPLRDTPPQSYLPRSMKPYFSSTFSLNALSKHRGTGMNYTV